jgi:hypothetical protein
MSDITTTTYENVRPPVSETGANDSSITNLVPRAFEERCEGKGWSRDA